MAMREITDYNAIVEEAARMVKEQGKDLQEMAELLVEESRAYFEPVSILKARADIRLALKRMEEEQEEEE